MAKVPLTELPIRIFRAIDDSGDYLAFVNAGTIHFTFMASSAMEAKRKAKTWLAEQTAKAARPAKKAEAAE